jgi:hypothetical protein
MTEFCPSCGNETEGAAALRGWRERGTFERVLLFVCECGTAWIRSQSPPATFESAAIPGWTWEGDGVDPDGVAAVKIAPEE